MVNFFVGEPVPNSKTTLTSYSPVLQGMIALGLACENVAMIVGQPWSALWLIFWYVPPQTYIARNTANISIPPQGNHERVNVVLRHWNRAGLLPVGLRLAIALRC